MPKLNAPLTFIPWLKGKDRRYHWLDLDHFPELKAVKDHQRVVMKATSPDTGEPTLLGVVLSGDHGRALRFKGAASVTVSYGKADGGYLKGILVDLATLEVIPDL